MAKFNGCEIKNLKFFKGHEGETCMQGTVYKDGKKLGFWSQDSWGGEDKFEFDTKTLFEPMFKFKSALNTKSMYQNIYNVAFFVNDLCSFKLLEMKLKEVLKKGRKGIYFAYELGMGEYCFIEYVNKSSVTEKDKANCRKHIVSNSMQEKGITPDILEGFAECVEDLTFVIGTEEGMLAEKTKFEEYTVQQEEKYQREKIEEEKRTEKYENNGRFTKDLNEEGPGVIIKDTQTGKEVVVPLYCSGEVFRVLVDLFCD
jgi:hypothetical protein